VRVREGTPKDTDEILDSLGIPDPAKSRRSPDDVAREALAFGFDEFRQRIQAIQKKEEHVKG
jgi:hypothetical protein